MFTMMSFKHVAYESKHFFLVKIYFSKNCHDRINVRSFEYEIQG